MENNSIQPHHYYASPWWLSKCQISINFDPKSYCFLLFRSFLQPFKFSVFNHFQFSTLISHRSFISTKVWYGKEYDSCFKCTLHWASLISCWIWWKLIQSKGIDLSQIIIYTKLIAMDSFLPMNYAFSILLMIW